MATSSSRFIRLTRHASTGTPDFSLGFTAFQASKLSQKVATNIILTPIGSNVVLFGQKIDKVGWAAPLYFAFYEDGAVFL
jgi:hypothetical protein